MTHADLGELALTCNEPEGAHHLERARAILAAIDAPAHVARVERLLTLATTTGLA